MTKPVHRVQFDVPLQRLEELDKLMPDRTRKDIFENAMLLLEWAVQERKLGHKIGSQENDGTFKEILLLGLR